MLDSKKLDLLIKSNASKSTLIDAIKTTDHSVPIVLYDALRKYCLNEDPEELLEGVKQYEEQIAYENQLLDFYGL